MKYSEETLLRLHDELIDILREIKRVCDKCHIPFFIQGGTAIGAFFDQDILPWDDDIDIGMTRANYERFLREAPGELGADYFLQHFSTEPATSFYFAKIRKNGTTFTELYDIGVPMHQGIYVDLFPYDLIPDAPGAARRQRMEVNWWVNCFIAKSMWPWRWFGHRDDGRYLPKSLLSCLLLKIVSGVCSKATIYRLLTRAQSRYNNRDYKYLNIVRMPKDQIAADCVAHPVTMLLHGLEVPAPADLESYLRHHYTNLRRNLPKAEQVNHAPEYLSFNPDDGNCLLPDE